MRAVFEVLGDIAFAIAFGIVVGAVAAVELSK